jgi:hypothetical protein
VANHLLLSSFLLFIADVISVSCFPADVGVPSVSGVSFVLDVLTVAAFLLLWRPGVVGIPAVDFIHAVAGILAVANISADPGVPILAGIFSYCHWAVQCAYTVQ